MSTKSKIEWTESTWNPATGCTKISAGCKYCYAEVMTKRFPLFHNDIPDSFIQKVFSIMNECPDHTFQVLTKRADRINKLNKSLFWTPNIWMGVTIENSEYYNRIKPLLQCKAKIKFLSLEPLIGPVNKINFKGIDWVIAGGESGRQSRPVKKSWIMNIKDKCRNLNIPFFFKQWGGKSKKTTGFLLDGKNYKEMPGCVGL